MRVRKATLRRLVLALAGLGLLAGVVAWYGFGEVGRAFAEVGWGVVWVSLFHFVPLACDTLGWRSLFAAAHRPSLVRMFLFRWVGEAVNNTLPVAQVGGDVVRARLATRAGAPRSASAAATIVDFTVGLLTQIIVALVALVLLALREGFDGWTGWLLGGLLALSILIAGFVALQAWGLFGRLRRGAALVLRLLPTRSLNSEKAGAGETLDARVVAIYRDHRDRLVADVCWRSAAWVVGTVEIWLALKFLDAPGGFVEAFIIHAVTMAIRSAAFFLPAGLGVQEGGFVAIGQLLGLAGPVALALGLVRRVREVLLGLPGLAVWWLLELPDATPKPSVQEP
ncbi:MAG: flippase-like domain-containing protein [Planctomycetes bacterium]|nr:flippase-like domain-containing protein [Planctomycetota bacterium]